MNNLIDMNTVKSCQASWKHMLDRPTQKRGKCGVTILRALETPGFQGCVDANEALQSDFLQAMVATTSAPTIGSNLMTYRLLECLLSGDAGTLEPQ